MKIVSAAPFVKVKEVSDVTTTMHQGFLKLEYFNDTPDSVAVLKVFSLESGTKKKNTSFTVSLKIKQGLNLIEQNLNGRLKLPDQATVEVQIQELSGRLYKQKMHIQNYL
ncbi:MAG: hypothetical protein QM781_13030 [Chitinophagaceae bacterium]